MSAPSGAVPILRGHAPRQVIGKARQQQREHSIHQASRMESKQLIAACGLGLALLGSPPAHAQHVPGIDRITQPQAREDRANLLREANRTLGEWQSAWARNDVRAVARLYAENAFLRMPNGTQLQGRNAIGKMLSDSLAELGSFNLGLADAEPGDMVYISGPFIYSDPDPLRPPVTGLHTVVLRFTGGSFKIRAQIFVPDVSAKNGDAPEGTAEPPTGGR